jgi:hypothetical protein
MQSIKRGDFYLWRIVVNRSQRAVSLSLSLSRSCNKYKSESNRRNAMLGCNLLKERRYHLKESLSTVPAVCRMLSASMTPKKRGDFYLLSR